MDKHRKALELAGHAGCILLKNGAEIFRVQETMIRILCAYGVSDHNVYVISNGIFATEGEGTDHALSLVRHVPLGGVNLSRIDAVNAVSREICAGKWSMDEAEAALAQGGSGQQQLDALNSANTLREVRAKVSAATGVPADLLSGDTEEACTAQAQAILKFAKPGYPNVRDGGDPHHTPTCSTRQQFADWFEQVTK